MKPALGQQEMLGRKTTLSRSIFFLRNKFELRERENGPFQDHTIFFPLQRGNCEKIRTFSGLLWMVNKKLGLSSMALV
jgi:hypothetical protein